MLSISNTKKLCVSVCMCECVCVFSREREREERESKLPRILQSYKRICYYCSLPPILCGVLRIHSHIVVPQLENKHTKTTSSVASTHTFSLSLSLSLSHFCIPFIHTFSLSSSFYQPHALSLLSYIPALFLFFSLSLSLSPRCFPISG